MRPGLEMLMDVVLRRWDFQPQTPCPLFSSQQQQQQHRNLSALGSQQVRDVFSIFALRRGGENASCPPPTLRKPILRVSLQQGSLGHQLSVMISTTLFSVSDLEME